MLARFGDVLYWIGTVIAVLLILAALAGLIFGQGDGRYFVLAMFVVFAVVAWLAGWACRYVLAGR